MVKDKTSAFRLTDAQKQEIEWCASVLSKTKTEYMLFLHEKFGLVIANEVKRKNVSGWICSDCGKANSYISLKCQFCKK